MGHPNCMGTPNCFHLCNFCMDYADKRPRMAESKVVEEAKQVLIDRGWVLLPPPNSGLDILKK